MTPSDDGRKRDDHHRAWIGPGNVARLLGEGLVGEQVGSCRRAGTCGPQESGLKESELPQLTRSEGHMTQHESEQNRDNKKNDSPQQLANALTTGFALYVTPFVQTRSARVC